MAIEIRPVQTHNEYRAVEQLQQDVWGRSSIALVHTSVLLTAQKNGGLVLGAFERGARPESNLGNSVGLVGFVFGFVGLTATGTVKHCSHIAGVLPRYQGQGVGYQLKLEQRKRVLAQGIELVTWTFDPLESRNAYFNLRKLGATCCTYWPNLYGIMRDALNADLPSDRFQLDWHLASDHVVRRLHDAAPAPSLASLQADGALLLNPNPPETLPDLAARVAKGAERLLVQVPLSFQTIKSTDMEEAQRWRLHTRDLFTAAFAGGYMATDFFVEGEQSYYLLENQSDET